MIAPTPVGAAMAAMLSSFSFKEKTVIAAMAAPTMAGAA